MYFFVFAGVFELYGFTNSKIMLRIPPHYSKNKYMEGWQKVLVYQVEHLVMSWQQVFHMFLWMALQSDWSIAKSNIVLTKKKILSNFIFITIILINMFKFDLQRS